MIQNDTSDLPPSGTGKDSYLSQAVPSIIFVAVLMVVGYVGNVLVCYVYGFRLRMRIQHFLFLTLAVFDVLTCVLSMAPLIAIRANYVTYTDASVHICRMMGFVVCFTFMASAFLLVVIAVDRYIKICRPLSRQMSLLHAKMAVAAVVLVTSVFAILSGVLGGVRTVEIAPTVSIEICGDESSVPKIYFFIYRISLLVVCFSVLLVLCVLYVLIWTAVKTYNRRPSTASSSSQTSSIRSSPSVRSNASTVRTRKTVATAFAVTLVFVVSYIPYFALIISRQMGSQFFKNNNVWYTILIRFPYLNAVANPFIYSALNPAFRAECFKLFVWLPFCKRPTQIRRKSTSESQRTEDGREHTQESGTEMIGIASSS